MPWDLSSKEHQLEIVDRIRNVIENYAYDGPGNFDEYDIMTMDETVPWTIEYQSSTHYLVPHEPVKEHVRGYLNADILEDCLQSLAQRHDQTVKVEAYDEKDEEFWVVEQLVPSDAAEPIAVGCGS